MKNFRYLRNRAFAIATVVLFTLTTTGCQHPVTGFEASFSCHIDSDYDIWILDGLTKDTANPSGNSGVGAGGCYPYQDPFDAGKTSGMAASGRQLPEYAYFWWSRTPKGNGDNWTKEQMRNYFYVTKHPQFKARVPIRSQIPESIVKEVKNAPMSKQYPGSKNLVLHLFFIWTKEGVQMTWRVENNDQFSVIKYGGYIPQPLSPRVIANLKRDKAQYIPPPPGAPPSLGVTQRIKQTAPP